MQVKNRQFNGNLVAKERGFVLILSLVLLAALTLIGVSSVNQSSLELRATANAKLHQFAFNATQSLLEYTTSDTGVDAIDYQTTAHDGAITYTTPITNATAVEAKVTYVGCSSAVGSSLEDGKGFSYSFFRVTGTAMNATGVAKSDQAQGVRYPAAGC